MDRRTPASPDSVGMGLRPAKLHEKGGAGAFACQLLIRAHGWQAAAPAPRPLRRSPLFRPCPDRHLHYHVTLARGRKRVWAPVFLEGTLRDLCNMRRDAQDAERRMRPVTSPPGQLAVSCPTRMVEGSGPASLPGRAHPA